MYDCESNDKQQTDSQLNPYEDVTLYDYELYNVLPESAEIKKWSILSAKIMLRIIYGYYQQTEKKVN